MKQESRPFVAPLQLHAQFQHYAWGDLEFIPRLYGLPVNGQPYAEAWIGAHPACPSIVEVGGERTGLDEVVARHPQAILGREVHSRFGGLPFLAKVLTAARPLSVQVHPSRAQAVAGFGRENEHGVPIDAFVRSYKDPNHKPELLVALTRFSALAGFRPLHEIESALRAAPELAAVLPSWSPSADGLRDMVAAYLTSPDDRLLPALSAWVERLRATSLAPHSAEWWVVEADRSFPDRSGRPDRGLFWLVLLNLVQLAPWQALYVPAGLPHAYLRGAGFEVMANSDNVIRGGLTPKHVDVRQLMAIVRFDSMRPPIVTAERISDTEVTYRTPAREFEVSRYDLIAGNSPPIRTTARGPEILVHLDDTGVAAGAVPYVAFDGGSLLLPSGGACLVPDGTRYGIDCRVDTTERQGAHGESVDRGVGTIVRVRVPEPRSLERFRGKKMRPLAFGTSGLRGLVDEITDLEAYVNTRGFLDFLVESGEGQTGSCVALAGDLRPSTDSPERSILRAVARAVEDAGFRAVHCGRIPTPALAYYAITRNWPSVMVTGSHIPFDRNGIKFNKRGGEVLKADEAEILRAVEYVRHQEYAQPEATSLFDSGGWFRAPADTRALPPPVTEARDLYIRRYLDFFPPQALAGLRVALYEHSAVGRDVLAEVLRALGATVHPVGRSAEFVPIDTEAMTEAKLSELQLLVDQISRRSVGRIDALVSTDGDSDRPLLAGIDSANLVHFIPGDLVGLMVADYLAADAVAVPITSTDAIELHLASRAVRSVRTRVGSPWVIAALDSLGGARRVGWEANGGFLTASEIERDGRRLAPLPTRDALLPLLAVLHAAVERRVSVNELAAQLPRRFSRSALIDGIPESAGRRLREHFAPQDAAIVAAWFDVADVRCRYANGRERVVAGPSGDELLRIRSELGEHFRADAGFGPVVSINWLDGIRITFDGGDVAHIRPSGNAPQLRIYAIASTEERATSIIAMGVREPDGLLREMLGHATQG